ncbi:MAG: amidohydrolase family protein [Hyphomicrobiales bacterium]|nr:amidohydrolase family protein [Hyphomicrobiales bacterium]
MLDLIIRNAKLSEFGDLRDIAIEDGKIRAIESQVLAEGVEVIDAEGCLVTPPFIDSHFHMDATLSYGQPRINQSGTLLEGITLWGELNPTQKVDDFRVRALEFCHWSIAQGVLGLRSHVDVTDKNLIAVEALLDVREKMKSYIDIQLVAFPQNGFLRSPGAKQNLLQALEMGVDVVGGIPHFERSMSDGAQSVRQLCEIAADKGLLVDMHCDESDDPWSRHIETLCAETTRLGLEGRVAGSHLTSMHSMDNYYVSKLMALMAEADMQVIANPLINITLQGRHDTYPKRRGMTRVKELIENDINVAFGHDCVMDPWYSFGSHDMLDVAHMGLHVAQMTSVEQTQSCFEAVTDNAAKVMQLENYGIAPGKNADLVILDCGSIFDAIRLRPARLHVVRRGQIISTTKRSKPSVTIEGNIREVDFRL